MVFKASCLKVFFSIFHIISEDTNKSKDFITVTPGIRKVKGTDDQKRVVTPSEARELGSDYIVVGRPITKAEDPLKEYREIKKDFLGGK